MATSRYFEGVGRRKTAIARVRISEGKGTAMVNKKKLEDYFQGPQLTAVVTSPLTELKITSMEISAMVSGGGIQAQAEAIRHGLSRALVEWDKENKSRLRVLGFLTRDPRMVERKKYGLKKARRRPQWAKR
jgi:small subunit ribosomal protein S9